MVKIGPELPKLSQNKTGYPFFSDHPVCVRSKVQFTVTDYTYMADYISKCVGNWHAARKMLQTFNNAKEKTLNQSVN